MTVFDTLDFPRSPAIVGPISYYVSEALAALVRASENPDRDPSLKPKEATPVTIVAGGTMTETLLACLTAGRPKQEMITARLKGGDAVLLTSAALCSISGEDHDEQFRPNSSLWEDALRRDDWRIVRHLRGDGKGQPAELGGITEVTPEEADPETIARKRNAAKWNKTPLTKQWNRYAGNALILTDSEYLDIRRRAGFDMESGVGIDPQLAKALRPLVKDYVIPDEPPDLSKAYQQRSRRSSAGGRRKSMAGHAVAAVKG